jgi:hypothetical protein
MPRSPRLGKRTKVGLVLAASMMLGLLTLEGGMRFVLFSETAREHRIGRGLRDAALYTPREAGRETWKLRALIEHHPARPAPAAHGRFGWLNTEIDPETLAHPDEALVGSRRPVLLFGDSYAQCLPESRIRWQDVMEEDSLAERYRLLNYGVIGYGLDQAHMLMGPVLERFRDRDPIVLVGILVDDDLDRSYLPLRTLPKPYFTLEGGELVLHPVEQSDPLSYLRAHPVRIRSYLWRWLLFGSGLVPPQTALAWTDEADHVAVKEALNRRILVEVQRALQRAGLSHFVVLFHAYRAFETPGPYGWQEPFLHRTLAELRMPFVSSKRFLRARAAEGAEPEDLYLQSGPGRNHYTAEGIRVVFEALREGLEGRFEPYAHAEER